jgi:hypothetical protein
MMNHVELQQGPKGLDGGLHYWLIVDGKPSSYAKVYVKDARVSLCDIETRESERNRGFASELLRRIAHENGVEKISHDGGYTPNGFDFISGMIEDLSPVDGPNFGPMDFVYDWDTMRQMNP